MSVNGTTRHSTARHGILFSHSFLHSTSSLAHPSALSHKVSGSTRHGTARLHFQPQFPSLHLSTCPAKRSQRHRNGTGSCLNRGVKSPCMIISGLLSRVLQAYRCRPSLGRRIRGSRPQMRRGIGGGAGLACICGGDHDACPEPSFRGGVGSGSSHRFPFLYCPSGHHISSHRH